MKIAIIGAGTLGCGWLISFARAGHEVRFFDQDPAAGPALLDALRRSDATVGLHPSFDSWNDAGLLATQRTWLEERLGRPVGAVRQHWESDEGGGEWKTVFDGRYTRR